MSLTDIMSGAGLSLYAEIALLLFLVAFCLIVWRTFSPSRKNEMERAAQLPLEDDTPTLTPHNARSTNGR
jgi:cbb3-type cytochrome oxidase subunit 3